MPRAPRTIYPGCAHHIIQRGNRRQRTFFDPADYRSYIELAREAFDEFGIVCWAWCLMPNHVHLVLVPSDTDGLTKAVARTHQRYTARVNAREGWQGYLWQGRFKSTPMDDEHLYVAARYIELNPVRSGLVSRAEDWPWSSARAHLAGRDDRLTCVSAMLSRTRSWAAYLRGDE
ncbi:transposase [uncultured Maricaulis sp.]|uniref:transposase n=1 Tax=uncultured Maricaulis sp. TaxID=174710 RepID=UPI0030DC0180|tara:strand:+ start:33028 stop:33549 length:522 start_codon:yes stop_codon:yes gene_type:complete